MILILLMFPLLDTWFAESAKNCTYVSTLLIIELIFLIPLAGIGYSRCQSSFRFELDVNKTFRFELISLHEINWLIEVARKLNRFSFKKMFSLRKNGFHFLYTSVNMHISTSIFNLQNVFLNFLFPIGNLIKWTCKKVHLPITDLDI